ncbi:MATE family efflux transporter [Flavobacterium silvaticum]|uniref:Multidrug-efflux transporter n=1 Tax=Flavobacterium silvaticum TaxID=1852020 RepID=A0A972FQ45_9FLAO|nr:MATE family efflux transporter [Flavobacterium silvaticum]NMH29305.1 MATE family efflux transporter [Flavobacterium silvaticum]
MALSNYTKEFSYNLKLAYPVILGMLGHTLIGIVDKLMVGRLGVAELAAVSLGNSFVFVAMSIGIGFSTAITPIVAQADAENDHGQIKSAFHHGLVLSTLMGVILFVAVFFCKPLMHFMGQPEAVIELATPYLGWVAFSLIPAIAYQGYKQFADGMSMTKYPMYAIVMSNIIHIPLNYFLIYGIWIFPKMGVTGAAIGTVISRIAMVVFMHLLLAKRSKLKEYFHDFSFSELKSGMTKKIIGLGLPSGMQMLFEVALFTSAIWLCGIIGTASQAANEIALTIATTTYMFAMGISVAGTIRVSNQKGISDIPGLIRIARSVFLLALIVEFAFALIFIVFNQALPALFLDLHNTQHQVENEHVVEIAAKLLIIAALFQLFDGVQTVVLGALRGVQDVKIPMYIAFASYWVVGFPLSYYLGLRTNLEAQGVWIGLLAALACASVFLYLRFNYVTKRLSVVSNNPKVQ